MKLIDEEEEAKRKKKLEDESTTIDPDLHTMDGSESNASGTNSVRNSP